MCSFRVQDPARHDASSVSVLFLCLALLAFLVRPCVAESLRLVSLSPSLTEIVFDLGLGSNLVGRSSACDYPPATEQVPVCGDFGRPNWELVQSLAPDAVLVTDLEKDAQIEQMAARGIRVLRLPCESWDAVRSAGMAIAEAAGCIEAGRSWGGDLERRRSEIERAVEETWAGERRPSVYIEVWRDPLTTAGRDTFIDEMIELAGGRNMAADLGAGYLHISAEWVVKQNPDVIVLAYMLSSGDASGSPGRRIGWGDIAAVRNERICAELDPDILLRPGPRLLDGAEQLAKWLAEMRSGQAGGAD